MADQLLGPDVKNDFPSQPPALIITPTRELALQVKAELDWLYAETGLILYQLSAVWISVPNAGRYQAALIF